MFNADLDLNGTAAKFDTVTTPNPLILSNLEALFFKYPNNYITDTNEISMAVGETYTLARPVIFYN